MPSSLFSNKTIKKVHLWIFIIFIITPLLSWIQWGKVGEYTPQDINWKPDVIIVLGGGCEARIREAFRWHKSYPEVPLIVTGDGGTIYQNLKKAGIPSDKLIHEPNATSTYENSVFCKSLIEQLDTERILLITNWFHARRALNMFRKQNPSKTITVSFERKNNLASNWERNVVRREKVATLFYALRYGLFPFS